MKNAKYFVIILPLFLGWFGCTPNRQSINKEEDTFLYAKGLSKKEMDNYTIITVSTPYKNANKALTYVLYPKEGKKPDIKADGFIPVPIRSIVCTSTTHIPLLDYLGENDKLIGFPTTDYISSPKMRSRVDSGKVVELGIDNALNIERLIELNPDLVMSYTMTGDYGQMKKIQQAGIPVLINAEYMEPDPLGRAEWIKLAGLLFGKEAEADSVFESIAANYNETKKLASQFSEHPNALSGILYSDTWYLPGGKNYAARLLDDAGYNYLWSADSAEGFLSLSYEAVLDKANHAEYWLGVGSYSTLAEMRDANEKYTYFDAFKNTKVYSYNKRIGAKGGSEFLELGYMRPDLILKDLLKIAHPDLLPEYELYFYFQLPKE